jgi:hypothetical protein
MNNKILESHLAKYLTVEDIVKTLGVAKKTVNNWINVGKRLTLKGENHKFSDPIRLPTPKVKSKVIVNPKDLERFLKRIGREDLIVNIPSYLK